ncbi:hypothetical protein [Zooshikella harenae]|uniref:DUF2066 domain-containing protein n=1 Tax=Zooshikella harenae TaxID=2827238 RepID=A0ABS5ZFN5_9GAMM|nr:hypothetical protein [Zooshikella harenae]MBU2712868.1 hypothetical protein [Zooshikella harenae]
MIKRFGLLALSISYAIASYGNTPIEINYAPEDQPILATVDAQGNIVINQYPKSFSINSNLYISSSQNYPLDKLVNTCKSVDEDLAIYKSYENAPFLQSHIKERIRESNTIQLSSYILPWLTGEFFIAAKQAAQDAGINANKYTIINGLSVQELTISIILTDDAVSNTIGDKVQLTHQLQSALANTDLATGQQTGQINALDLTCDMLTGKANITLQVNGSKQQNHSFDTILYGDQIQTLAKAINTLPKTFYKNIATLPEKTKITAYLIGQETYKRNISLAPIDVNTVLSHLIDKNTGMLVNDLDLLINNGITKPKPQQDYQGIATFKFKNI